jgi:hypothetical protein
MPADVPLARREPCAARDGRGDGERDDPDDLVEPGDEPARRSAAASLGNGPLDDIGPAVLAAADGTSTRSSALHVPGGDAVLVDRQHGLLVAARRSRHGQGHRLPPATGGAARALADRPDVTRPGDDDLALGLHLESTQGLVEGLLRPAPAQRPIAGRPFDRDLALQLGRIDDDVVDLGAAAVVERARCHRSGTSLRNPPTTNDGWPNSWYAIHVADVNS